MNVLHCRGLTNNRDVKKIMMRRQGAINYNILTKRSF
jgi:hypothetical protein